MKRGRDEQDDEDYYQNGTSTTDQGSEQPSKLETADLDDDDLDLPVQPAKRASQIRKGHECPYLDTVSRQASCTTVDKCP